MEFGILGETGIRVSRMCFGTLPMGPLQKNVDLELGVDLLVNAFRSGVNFVDTAQSYKTYPYIKEALRRYGGDIVVATKSAAADYDGMKAAVLEALEGLGRDYIDIFHLHAARVTPTVFNDRSGALRCLSEMKRAGIIKAVGIATHSVAVVREAALRNDIDVVHPLINITGMGILGGTPGDMAEAIRMCAANGKGLYAMKALAGGNLLSRISEAIAYVLGVEGISAIAVGMVHPDELATNLRIFTDPDFTPATTGVPVDKRVVILGFCQGCGRCVATCPNHALSLKDGKAVIDHSSCLLCGYCSPVCPQFAIRVV